MRWVHYDKGALLFQRSAFVSEPAILVKRKGKGSQVWSMEKFENKIIDMRDMYEERKERGGPLTVHGGHFDNMADDEDSILYVVCSMLLFCFGLFKLITHQSSSFNVYSSIHPSIC